MQTTLTFSADSSDLFSGHFDTRLDERTKAVGRQGIASARLALENCRSVEAIAA